MKAGIHPNLHTVKVKCVCGNEFDSESTVKGDEVRVEICSNCHPFYTGKKTQVDQGGRLDKFNKKLNNTKK